MERHEEIWRDLRRHERPKETWRDMKRNKRHIGDIQETYGWHKRDKRVKKDKSEKRDKWDKRNQRDIGDMKTHEDTWREMKKKPLEIFAWQTFRQIFRPRDTPSYRDVRTHLTRPDTRQSSCGWLGRSSNAKNRLEFKNVMDQPTYWRNDRARCRVACPRLKIIYMSTLCLKAIAQAKVFSWTNHPWFSKCILCWGNR